MLNLVTGGAGFFGSHLANALVDDGEYVIIVDNLSTGHVRNLEHAVSSGRATFVYGDVAVPPDALAALLRDALRGQRVDRIWHLASPASPEAYGAHPVGNAGRQRPRDDGADRFRAASRKRVFCSPRPRRSTAIRSCIRSRNRTSATSIRSDRAAVTMKASASAKPAVAAAVRARGLDGRLVRFFNCYGPMMERGDGRLIPALVDALQSGRPLPIQGTGKQTRSMTFVDDAIALLRLVMAAPADEPAADQHR